MSADIIERASQIEFDHVAYRKSDCEGKHWAKVEEFWYDEMVECIPGLVAEVKRLREELAAKDAEIAYYQEQAKSYSDEANCLREQIARWQEIAIDATAKATWMEEDVANCADDWGKIGRDEQRKQAARELGIQPESYPHRLEAEIERLRNIAIEQHALIKSIETQEGYAYSEHVVLSDRELEQAAEELGVPIHQDKTYKKIAIKHLAWAKFIEDELDAIPQEKNYEDYRERYEREAANDLNIQISRDANYLKRLEGFALSMAIEAGWDMEEARAALEKIRHET